jgi:chemotaxis protein CheX
MGRSRRRVVMTIVKEMDQAMAFSLRDHMHVVSDPQNLDASVREVFELMLGVSCRCDSEPQPCTTEQSESVTAVVGFGGLLSGACVLRCNRIAAIEIAARLTGMEFDQVDDTVKDGVGEICNVLAGAWKSKVPRLAENCGLSIPAVITGSDYNLRVQDLQFQLHRTYFFEEQCFELMIVCDSLQ